MIKQLIPTLALLEWYIFYSRYAIVFSVTNALGTKYAEYAIDNFSLSPQCFGLGVPSDQVDDWRYNMTDLQFCKYYGKFFSLAVM